MHPQQINKAPPVSHGQLFLARLPIVLGLDAVDGELPARELLDQGDELVLRETEGLGRDVFVCRLVGVLQDAGDGLADLRERAGLEPFVARVDNGGRLVLEVDDA